MSTKAHLELGCSGSLFLAQLSLGVPKPINPFLPFNLRMI